ncbi:MAG: FtsQ-type POTRA domain-containing protein [Verrucomicrobia bacterium]|jgi:cell division protein FtsQ|nr:FtsQ-type POTRA domain-containing protein [Verrucomicrobiota bacterium]MDA1202713.1 FtsQ-type POTRA domain-containing protein [Verrucomicrobiota bacterium]
MNFFSRKKPRRRRPVRRGRREHLLEVTATAETERRRRNQKALLYTCEALFLTGLLVVAWFGVNLFIENFFTKNKNYEVRVVEVNTDGVMTREEALVKTGIHEGLNIFSLNLESAQSALTSIPEIQSARVERILPDTVSISIEARRPVAWVAPADTGADPSTMETACLVDATGVMIKPQGFEASYTRLPVVYGVPTEQWRLGDKIEMPELLVALDLLGLAAERTTPEVKLRAVDISKSWCLMAWNDPQTRLTFGPDDLPAQLDRLQLILLHVGQTSRRVATVNLIPARNTPVTFVGEAPAAEGATAPTTAKNR